MNNSPDSIPISRQTSMSTHKHSQAFVKTMHSVIFSGYLNKESRHGRYQRRYTNLLFIFRRLIRFDGILLVCLSHKEIYLPSDLIISKFNPLAHPLAEQLLPTEFLALLRRFYPTDPTSIIQLMSPLIANTIGGYSEEDEFGIPDSSSRYFLLPKVKTPVNFLNHFYIL